MEAEPTLEVLSEMYHEPMTEELMAIICHFDRWQRWRHVVSCHVESCNMWGYSIFCRSLWHQLVILPSVQTPKRRSGTRLFSSDCGGRLAGWLVQT